MKIGYLKFEKPLILAPMEGVTDLPFRIICRKMGADLVYSEFIAAEALFRDSVKSRKKMIIAKDEHPVAIQIFGANVEPMVESAKMVEDSGADILDINFGCWVKKVVNNEAGAAFLKNLARMAEMTEAVASAVDIPVTVKTRLGWTSDWIVIEEAAKLVEQAGAKAIAVHCRTREQGMQGSADWSWISKVKAAVDIPVILNGDVRTSAEIRKAFDETGCNGVMIGRAAIGNPFIFKYGREFLKSGVEPPQADFREKIDLCLEHLQLNIISKGFPRGLYEFRKHYSGYLKGYFGASQVRQQLVVTETYDEIADALYKYKDYLEEREKNENLVQY